MTATRGGRALAGGALVAGGALAVAGALLPWLTFYAGLVTMAGVRGLYGWLVLGGGVLAAACGLAVLLRGSTRAWGAGAAVAAGLLAFTLWLLPRQQATLDRLLESPFTAPALGPGVTVALVGAAVATLSLLAGVRRPRAAFARTRR